MPVLLVTFERYKADPAPVESFIGQFKNVRLTDTTYAVKSKLHPRVFAQELKELLPKDTTYYVAELTAPFDGFGPTDVNGWLDKYLKK